MSARIAASMILLASTAGSAVGQVATANPHGQLPDELSCTACHTAEAWSPLRTDLEFDHASTGFGLDGRHNDVTCASCHQEMVFDEVAADPGDCASCHLDVHLGTPTRPCAACHTTESFSLLPSGLVHPADFPLEGAHLQASCEGCHTDDLGGAFSPPDRECSSCHMGDYFGAPLVDHQALGFSTYCLDCHSTLDFRDVAFDHFTVSGGFELRGQHAGVECTTCHSLPNGDLPLAPSGPQDCVTCHLPDYQGEHGGSGFPVDCLVCHNESTWDDADFDHLLATGFELIGPHALIDCVFCHVGSSSATIFSPTGPQDCVACHQADYDQQHGGAGFSTDCLTCHTIDTWSGATFDHLAVTGFDLIGNHGLLACTACHAGSSGGPTLFSPSGSQDCVACHQADYDRQHAGTGFSTNCVDCHQLTTWSGATFSHPFPISSVPHGGRQCSECHTVPNDFSQFTCTSACHHTQSRTDDQHGGVNGYVYESASCLSCHPDGRDR